MKKLVLLIGIMVMTLGLAKAQDVKVSGDGPEIQFEKLEHNYGDVPYNANEGYVECEFHFTNTGNEPLILQKPKSTCGCTVPSWPKEPILPGNSDVIKVTYRSTKVGKIDKSITVNSNAKENATVILHISGKVLEQVNETLPEKDMGVGSPINNN